MPELLAEVPDWNPMIVESLIIKLLKDEFGSNHNKNATVNYDEYNRFYSINVQYGTQKEKIAISEKIKAKLMVLLGSNLTPSANQFALYIHFLSVQWAPYVWHNCVEGDIKKVFDFGNLKSTAKIVVGADGSINSTNLGTSDEDKKESNAVSEIFKAAYSANSTATNPFNLHAICKDLFKNEFSDAFQKLEAHMHPETHLANVKAAAKPNRNAEERQISASEFKKFVPKIVPISSDGEKAEDSTTRNLASTVDNSENPKSTSTNSPDLSPLFDLLSSCPASLPVALSVCLSVLGENEVKEEDVQNLIVHLIEGVLMDAGLQYNDRIPSDEIVHEINRKRIARGNNEELISNDNSSTDVLKLGQTAFLTSRVLQFF